MVPASVTLKPPWSLRHPDPGLFHHLFPSRNLRLEKVPELRGSTATRLGAELREGILYPGVGQGPVHRLIQRGNAQMPRRLCSVRCATKMWSMACFAGTLPSEQGQE